MPLVLSLLADAASGGPLSISLAGVVPNRIVDLPLDALRRLLVRADERPCALGDVMNVAGESSDGVIECQGDFGRVHDVGAHMTSGTIRVTGNVGRHAGEGMMGGQLHIAGGAGDWLAAEMTGGLVQVTGSAGDNVAGALPGSDHGLRGGLVIVLADAGQFAGQRMRRGILAIGGNCQDAPAFEMRAGTVVVAGRVGPNPGLGMGRGSLVALSDAPAVPATFERGRAWNPPFLGLLFGQLKEVGFCLPQDIPGRWRQWHGDLLNGCRGEILCPESA